MKLLLWSGAIEKIELNKINLTFKRGGEVPLRGGGGVQVNLLK